MDNIEKMGQQIFKGLLLTMEGLKDHKDRDKFCNNFDEEYEKLKVKVAEFDEEVE